MSGPTVTLTFAGESKSLDQTINGVGASTDKVGKSFDKLKGTADVAAAAILGGLGVAAKMFTDAASAQEQAFGGLDSVFKENSAVVKGWAANAADAVGLSKASYAELAAPIGAALKGAGMSIDEATKKTGGLIQVGADLSATFGGSTAEATGALGAALRGEFDSLERFGIALTADGVKAELAARGQDKLTGAAAKLAEKQAILDLVMKGSADSTGQFARESDSAAGAAERQQAKWENVQAQFGEKLIPMLTNVTGKLTELTGWLAEHETVVFAVAGALGVFAAAYVAVRLAMAAQQVVMAAVTVAQWAFNVAVSANPIGLIIIAIAAFIGALVLLWKNNETFRNIVMGVWSAVSSAIGGAVSWIGNTIGNLVGWFQTAAGRIGGIFSGIAGGISSAFRSAFNFVSDAYNNTIGRLSITIPGWVPGIGGNTFSAPRLPRFHSGGVVPGMAGSEMLAVLQAGEQVIPAGGGGGGGMTVRFTGNTSDALATVIMQLIRSGRIQLSNGV